ncbi:hypothetical protein AH06_274 [Erwinia phage AH06]|nr:hypothetical protein AH06_274 [Erwinia phage AH06]
MSQKKGVSEIKLTGIMGSDGYYHIVSGDTTSLNANGRHYNPVVLQYMVNGDRLNRRAFNTDVEHPVSRKTLFQKYLGLVPDDDHYRGTPAQRHPFMRAMALRFSVAMESARISSYRQTAGGDRIHYLLQQFHNHYLNEMAEIKASRPIPIDLTRYARLLKWEAVKTERPVVGMWDSEFAGLYFQPYRAGVGKSMFYSMLPGIKLHLGGIHATIGGRPWIYESSCMGPAGFWPTTIEDGMAHDGPAITAQFNRERMAKPKKGRV